MSDTVQDGSSLCHDASTDPISGTLSGSMAIETVR